LSLRGIRRLGSLAVPLTVFALSACGGGGGSSTPSVPPTATPAPVTTATPAPNPTASGDAFAYAGSLTQTFTVYGTPAPAPSPSATPMPVSTPWISTVTQNVTQNVTVASGQSFNSQSGLTGFTTKETDAGQQTTTTVTSQTYLSYAPDSSRPNGVDVTEIGTSSSDSNGVSFQSALASGNGVVNKFPGLAGAQWTNGAARTDTEKDPDGQTTTTTYAADGSYQEQILYPEGGNVSTVQANSDGSGVYQFPVSGNTFSNSSLTINAPVSGQIQVAYQFYVPHSFPQFGAVMVPLWYPQTPPVLASDTYVDEGPATLPSSCSAATAYQSPSLEKIVETKNRLDTVFGEYETEQVTQYTNPSYGLVCTVVNDDLKSYYDYSGQAGFSFDWSPTPLLDTTVTETLALQSAQFASSAASHRTAQSISTHILPQPSLARTRMILAAIHARHIRALYVSTHSGTRQSK